MSNSFIIYFTFIFSIIKKFFQALIYITPKGFHICLEEEIDKRESKICTGGYLTENRYFNVTIKKVPYFTHDYYRIFSDTILSCLPSDEWNGELEILNPNIISIRPKLHSKKERSLLLEFERKVEVSNEIYVNINPATQDRILIEKIKNACPKERDPSEIKEVIVKNKMGIVAKEYPIELEKIYKAPKKICICSIDPTKYKPGVQMHTTLKSTNTLIDCKPIIIGKLDGTFSNGLITFTIDKIDAGEECKFVVGIWF